MKTIHQKPLAAFLDHALEECGRLPPIDDSIGLRSLFGGAFLWAVGAAALLTLWVALVP